MGEQKDIDAASDKLLDIAKDIDEEKTGRQSFLMVVTKDNLTYRRKDGVYVIPLGCLKN